jgi:hypothetical protein
MTGGSAVMISLESTSISACSYGSLVSNGAFENLCIRFEDEFEVNTTEWKPDWDDPALMNLCVVASGTYQIGSRYATQESEYLHLSLFMIYLLESSFCFIIYIFSVRYWCLLIYSGIAV